MNNSHRGLSPHLIYRPQFSAVGRHGTAPVSPVDLSAALSPGGGGGSSGPLKGLRSFPLPRGSGSENKMSSFGQPCFISNAAAAF